MKTLLSSDIDPEIGSVFGLGNIVEEHTIVNLLKFTKGAPRRKGCTKSFIKKRIKFYK